MIQSALKSMSIAVLTSAGFGSAIARGHLCKSGGLFVLGDVHAAIGDVTI